MSRFCHRPRRPNRCFIFVGTPGTLLAKRDGRDGSFRPISCDRRSRFVLACSSPIAGSCSTAGDSCSVRSLFPFQKQRFAYKTGVSFSNIPELWLLRFQSVAPCGENRRPSAFRRPRPSPGTFITGQDMLHFYPII